MTEPRRDLQASHEAQHSFDVVLRGYDRNQVAETIERLEADFRIAIADRDATAARTADLASQLSALHGEIESLRRKAAQATAPTFENISERIQHMLQLAEEEAGEIRRAAEIDAAAVREQTAAEERAMLERHAAGQAEVERMIAEARQAAEQIAQKAQLRADELVAKAQERVARLDAESQARRAKVEEDFEIAQRARRIEAARAEEERERISTEAARQRIAAAEQQAAQMIADAEAKAEAIRDVRDELTGRLLQARQLLSTLPDLSDRSQSAPAGERPSAPAETPSAQRLAAAAQPQPQPAAQPAQGTRTSDPESTVRQQVRSEPATTQFAAPTASRTEGPATGRLPMPPRPTAQSEPAGIPAGQETPRQQTPSAETTRPDAPRTDAPRPTPAPKAPQTQAIDQPVEARN